MFQSRASRVTFTGLEPVYVDGTGIVDGTFTFTTPSSESGNDSIFIHSPSAGKNRVSGTSGGVPFESITFSNYAHFVVDTSANDKPDFDTDSIVFASPLVATGLETFIVRTGAGDDTVDLQGLDWSNSVDVSLSLGAGSNRLIKPMSGGVWDFATFDSGTLKGVSGPGSVSFSGVSKALVRTMSGGLVQDASVNRQPTVLVFVEDALPDYQKLIDSLFGVGRVAGQLDYQTALVVLDGSGDGVQQITETLSEAAYRSISAIHILSHGSVGVLGLGSVDLSRSGLDAYGTQFSDWRRALAEDADILLYGCRIGAGDPGGQFVERFAELTGADVAASIDDTGGSSRGGNWNLEFEFGDLEATRLVPDLSVAEYAELLVDKTVVGTTPVTADINGGTLTGDTANNTLISNEGQDTLEGKAGNDTYRFNDKFNNDTINELSGNDILDFTKVAAKLKITVKALSSNKLNRVEIQDQSTAANKVTLNANPANGVLTIKSGTNTDDTLDLSNVGVDLKVTIKSKQIVVSLATTPATQLLIVEGVENLKFGDTDNTVTFEKGAKLAGKLEGGTGTNTLDYGGETLDWFGNFYTTQLQVNLTNSAKTAGPSQIQANSASNVNSGTAGNVVGFRNVIGGVKDDVIYGSDSVGILRGGRGNDKLFGGNANDQLFGYAGNDTLTGDKGNDELEGGPDDDTYVFSGAWEQDTVVEKLNEGTDTLDFSAVTAALTFDLKTDGGHVVTESANTVKQAEINSTGQPFVIERIIANNTRATPTANPTPAQENTYKFNVDWGNQGGTKRIPLTIENKLADGKTPTVDPTAKLDFTAVTSNLVFDIKEKGAVGVKSSAVDEVNIEGIAEVIGGQGNNTYKFIGQDAKLTKLTPGSPSTPATAIPGRQNILDYSKYGTFIDANLTNVAVDVDTSLRVTQTPPASGGTIPPGVIPQQEKWVFEVPLLKGEISFGGGATAKFNATPGIFGNSAQTDQQAVKKALESYIRRSDFTVERDVELARSTTIWTIIFSEPQPIQNNGTDWFGELKILAADGIATIRTLSANDIQTALKNVQGTTTVTGTSTTGSWDVSYEFETDSAAPTAKAFVAGDGKARVTTREFKETNFEQTVTLPPTGYTKYTQNIHVEQAGYTTYEQLIVLLDQAATPTTFALNFGSTTLTIDKTAALTDIGTKLQTVSDILTGSVTVTGGGALGNPWKVQYKSANDVALSASQKLTSADTNKVTVSAVTKTQDTFGLEFDGTTLPINKASAAADIKRELETIRAKIQSVDPVTGSGTASQPWVVTYTSKDDAPLTATQIISAAAGSGINIGSTVTKSQDTIVLNLITGAVGVDGVFTLTNTDTVTITKHTVGQTVAAAIQDKVQAALRTNLTSGTATVTVTGTGSATSGPWKIVSTVPVGTTPGSNETFKAWLEAAVPGQLTVTPAAKGKKTYKQTLAPVGTPTDFLLGFGAAGNVTPWGNGIAKLTSFTSSDIQNELKRVQATTTVTGANTTGPWNVSYDIETDQAPADLAFAAGDTNSNVSPREFQKTDFKQTVTLPPEGYTKYTQDIYVEQDGYTTYKQVITLSNPALATFDLSFDGTVFNITTTDAASDTSTNGIKKNLENFSNIILRGTQGVTVTSSGTGTGPWTVVYKSKDDVALTTAQTLTSANPDITVSPVTKTQDTFDLKFDTTTFTINKDTATADIKRKLENIRAKIQTVDAVTGSGTAGQPWVVTYTSKDDAPLTPAIEAVAVTMINVGSVTKTLTDIEFTLKTGTVDTNGVFTLTNTDPVKITKPTSSTTVAAAIQAELANKLQTRLTAGTATVTVTGTGTATGGPWTIVSTVPGTANETFKAWLESNASVPANLVVTPAAKGKKTYKQILSLTPPSPLPTEVVLRFGSGRDSKSTQTPGVKAVDTVWDVYNKATGGTFKLNVEFNNYVTPSTSQTVTTEPIPYDASPLVVQEKIQEQIDKVVLTSIYEQKIYLSTGSETEYTQEITVPSSPADASFDLLFDGERFTVLKTAVKDEIEVGMKKIPSIASVKVALVANSTDKWFVTYTIKDGVKPTPNQKLMAYVSGGVTVDLTATKTKDKFSLKFGTQETEIAKDEAVLQIKAWLEGLKVPPAGPTSIFSDVKVRGAGTNLDPWVVQYMFASNPPSTDRITYKNILDRLTLSVGSRSETPGVLVPGFDVEPKVIVYGMGTAAYPWRINLGNLGDASVAENGTPSLTMSPRGQIAANKVAGVVDPLVVFGATSTGVKNSITQIIGSGYDDRIYGVDIASNKLDEFLVKPYASGGTLATGEWGVTPDALFFHPSSPPKFNLIDGQAVLYQVETGKETINGLVDGQVYFVRVVDAPAPTGYKKVYLYESPTEAAKNTLLSGTPKGNSVNLSLSSANISGDKHFLYDVLVANGGACNSGFFGSANSVCNKRLVAATDNLANVLIGNKGDDLMVGSDESDYLDGGNGNDTLYSDGKHSGTSSSTVTADIVYGGAGDDSLFGNTGDDSLVGGAGNDKLAGGVGSDTVDGGDGNDTLINMEDGKPEDYDLLNGGKGADTYKFQGTWGVASIVDSGGTDTIDLSNSSKSYTYVLSNGNLFATPGSLYESKITNTAGEKIALGLDLDSLKNDKASPGEVLTTWGFGFHQAASGTKGLLGFITQSRDASLIAYGTLPTTSTAYEKLNFLLHTDRGDGASDYVVKLPSGSFTLEDMKGVLGAALYNAAEVPAANGGSHVPIAYTPTSLTETLAAELLKETGLSVELVTNVLGGHLPSTKFLQIKVTANGSKDDDGYVIPAKIEMSVQGANSIVAASSNFENIDEIKISAGANSFVFGNDYWGGTKKVYSVAQAIPVADVIARYFQNKLTIDTTEMQKENAPLVLDFRAVNQQLYFNFAATDNTNYVELSVSTVSDMTLPIVDLGPIVRDNKVVFTKVDKNAVIYGGRYKNTFNFEPSATFQGRLVGGQGGGFAASAYFPGRTLDRARELAGFVESNVFDLPSASSLSSFYFQVQNQLSYSGPQLT
ncbi:MAG: DUF4347 domain-containing protein, partial [Planctomycetota bacterium]